MNKVSLESLQVSASGGVRLGLLGPHDEHLRKIVGRLASLVIAEMGCHDIEAIILTGSLARLEATLLVELPFLRLLGDVECLVIVKDKVQVGGARKRLSALAESASLEFAHEGFEAKCDLVPAHVNYLTDAIRPSIFAYDLKAHGKVVFGDPTILHKVKDFPVSAIPREDAVRLTMNRLVELFIMAGGTAADPLATAYHFVKVMLDLAGSLQAFEGCYISSYADRASRFEEFAATHENILDALTEPAAFMRDLSWAKNCKINVTRELLLRPDLSMVQSRVLSTAKTVLAWELGCWLQRPEADFRTLMSAFVRQESIAARLRGWAKFWLHPLRPTGVAAVGRSARLALRGSPQRLCYAALLLSAWAGDSQRSDWQIAASAQLPVVHKRDGSESLLRQAGETWAWLIRNN